MYKKGEEQICSLKSGEEQPESWRTWNTTDRSESVAVGQ